ncbi:VOC family protein [Streptodolium elevatio]
MGLRIANVSIDTNDLAGSTAFWAAVTGYKVDAQDDAYTYLVDPEGAGPGLCINVVPERREGKNRLHLDLVTDDLHAEAARVEALGAKRLSRHGEGTSGWVVFGDNEGNQFCVCAT